MLLIGNGCFVELSLLLRVIMVCVFFLILYINNTSTGNNCPGVAYSRFVIQPDDGPGIGPKHVVVNLTIISQ